MPTSSPCHVISTEGGVFRGGALEVSNFSLLTHVFQFWAPPGGSSFEVTHATIPLSAEQARRRSSSGFKQKWLPLPIPSPVSISVSTPIYVPILPPIHASLFLISTLPPSHLLFLFPIPIIPVPHHSASPLSKYPHKRITPPYPMMKHIEIDSLTDLTQSLLFMQVKHREIHAATKSAHWNRGSLFLDFWGSGAFDSQARPFSDLGSDGRNRPVIP